MPYARQKTLLTGNVILRIRYFLYMYVKKFVRKESKHFVTRISLTGEIGLYHLA